jgi:ribonuclease HII
MEQAVLRLNTRPDAVLVDAMSLPGIMVPQRAIIHGDATSYLIAAASIVAKVARDWFMTDYDARYPRYEFAVHKGYGTPRHLERLARLGPCRIHRRTFGPVMGEAVGDGR